MYLHALRTYIYFYIYFYSYFHSYFFNCININININLDINIDIRFVMQLAFRTLRLHKRIPLAISRGVSGDADNLFVSVTFDDAIGWGEMAPGARQGAASAAAGEAALRKFAEAFNDEARALDAQDKTLSPMQVHARACDAQVPPCALAALDIALWDALARSGGLPLYQLLGMPPPRAPTSITLGICAPDIVRERIAQLQLDKFRALKIKLGSPDGIDADQAMLAQVRECVRKRLRDESLRLRVDANGGWNLAQARTMMKWLAERDVEYIEQPLAEGNDAELPALFADRPLPIFIDESCSNAADVPRLAAAVDGVNLKLMKCGGITEALRIIAVARALRLQTMIGCMGESSLAISAAAALGGAIDYIDLDSHFNLNPDPCIGAQLVNGIVTPNQQPGHGAGFVQC